MSRGARSERLHPHPIARLRQAGGFKEWYHFVVHRSGGRILINFSLTTKRPHGLASADTPRHSDRASTSAGPAIERFDNSELDVSADLSVLTIAGNRMTVRPDGYRVVIDLPGHDIRGESDLTSVSRPFCINNQPVGDGRVSWLFVPRLRADGWVRIGGREIRLEGDAAYHDHNWGRFQWGGDFGWTWGTILPSEPDDPWSLVFQRNDGSATVACLPGAMGVAP